MKKNIFAIFAVILCVIFVGCGAEASTPESSSEPTATIEVMTNAVEYPEITWGGVGILENIPHPDWITNGEIQYNRNEVGYMYVGYVTKDNFKEYTKLCYEAGYNDISINSDDKFGASNESGGSIILRYKPGYVMEIWVGEAGQW